MPPGKPTSHSASNRTPGPWRQQGWTPYHHGGADTQPLPRRAPTLTEDAPQAGVGGTVLQLKPRWAAPRRPAGPAVTSRPKTEPGGSGRENCFVGWGILRVRGKGFRNNTPRHRGQQAGQGSNLSYSGEKEAAYRGVDVRYQGNQQLGRSLPALRLTITARADVSL